MEGKEKLAGNEKMAGDSHLAGKEKVEGNNHLEGKEKKEMAGNEKMAGNDHLAGNEDTPSERTNSLPCLSRIPQYDWFVRDRHRSESRGNE